MSWLVSNIGSSGKTGGVTARGEDGQQIGVDAVLEGEGGQLFMLTQFMTREGEEGETVSMMEVQDGSIKKTRLQKKGQKCF